MAERVQRQKSSSGRTEESVDSTVAGTAEAEKIKADLDGLLDEIDEVLEENAEEFVKNYVQKGGQ